MVCPKLLVTRDHLGWFQNRHIVPAEAEKTGQVAKGSGPDAAHTLATAYLNTTNNLKAGFLDREEPASPSSLRGYLESTSVVMLSPWTHL